MRLTDSTPEDSGPASETPGAAPQWTLPVIALGTGVIIATYLLVLFTQPATVPEELDRSALIVLAGYLTGGVLIAAGTLPRISRSTLALMPAMIAVNIVIGQVVGTLTPIPLYLDSLGSVFIGALAGPAAGALTGILTNVIWGATINPTVIFFTAGAALIGAAAGWAARFGAFRAVWWAVLAGGLAGIPTGLLGAPVAAYVFGGGLGVGTGGAVAVLQAAGFEMLQATTLQSLPSDIADKAITFALICAAIWALPRRLLTRHTFTRHTVARPSRPA